MAERSKEAKNTITDFRGAIDESWSKNRNMRRQRGCMREAEGR